MRWCMEKNGQMLRERWCIPNDEHVIEKADLVQMTDFRNVLPCLAPERSISFVEYEGRRFRGAIHVYGKEGTRDAQRR